MRTEPRGPAVRAIAQRDDRGKWVVSWPAGYFYDFWTDRTAAERAARVATRVLQTADSTDRKAIDEALKRRGLLVRARMRQAC